MIISIDGKFVLRPVGGQERFAMETLYELDKICKPGEFQLIVPKYWRELPAFLNIKIIHFGKIRSPLLWEQICFLKFIKKTRTKGLYLLNTWPISRPDFPTLHDTVMFAHPEFFRTNFYSYLSC